MKTPEDWIHEVTQTLFIKSTIAAIQQDARRQGYTEAAEIVARNWNGQRSNYCDLIEAARDNLTMP